MPDIVIFQSERKFILESYAASHGLLLFRANRTNTDPTVIDVLFTDVRSMDTRAWSNGLTIERIEIEVLRGYLSNPAAMIESGLFAYRVTGIGWQGYVIAANLRFKEGASAPRTPAGLLDPIG